MGPILTGLVRLLHTLPAILLVTFVEVIICFTIGYAVMCNLIAGPGRNHPHIVLWVAVLSAVLTQAWILFNHKIRKYIKSRSTE